MPPSGFAISRRLLIASLAAALAFDSLGQDWQTESRVKSLRGLTSVALVFRGNSPIEVYTVKEWSNLIELDLGRNAPDLKLVGTEASANWLELSIVSTEQGGAFELSLHRSVKISAMGQDVLAKVWSESRFIFGSVSKQSMREALEALTLSFTADYSRARRR